MIMLAVLAFLVAGGIWLAVFVYTPVRNLLPERFTVELRDKYDDMSVRLDSVADVTHTYGRYYDNLHAILTDSLPASAAISTAKPSDLQDLPLDSLLPATDREKNFVTSFEDQERFNLSVLSPIAAEGMTFFPPLSAANVDIVASSGDIPSVTITTTSATGVSAIYRGTVVSSAFTSGRGWTVIIQHPNDFVSVYIGLSETFCVRGNKVTTGQRIGLTDGRQFPFTFELWHNGSPLPPTDYVFF